MDNYTEKMMVIFERDSGKLFSQLFGEFEASTKNLNRRKDENVFQKTAARYIDNLKQQLTELSIRLIENQNNPHQDSFSLRQLLTRRLVEYANEFSQKIKQL